MDRDEVARLLRAEMIRFARRSRAELAQLSGQVEVCSVEGAGGLRSSFSPMTDGFPVDAGGAIEMADLETPG